MATLQNPLAARGIGVTLTQVGPQVPGSTNWIVSSITVANTTLGAINVGVTVYDGVNHTYLAKNVNLPVGETLTIGSGGAKVILGTGYAIFAVSDTAASCDASISYASVP